MFKSHRYLPLVLSCFLSHSPSSNQCLSISAETSATSGRVATGVQTLGFGHIRGKIRRKSKYEQLLWNTVQISKSLIQSIIFLQHLSGITGIHPALHLADVLQHAAGVEVHQVTPPGLGALAVVIGEQPGRGGRAVPELPRQTLHMADSGCQGGGTHAWQGRGLFRDNSKSLVLCTLFF